MNPRNPFYSKSGAALVLVLSCLALLTVVVISYLAGTAQELATSKSYTDQVRTRVLAGTALELVKGQIWAATTETNGSAATSWASQPGALRTFKSGDTSLANVYKLYSSGTMVVGNSAYSPATEVPSNWASRPNEYVDLNLPVVVGSGTNYPILNPDAAATSGAVAGFSLSGTMPKTATSPLPMPVQWIYVRRSGTMTMSGTGAYNAADPIVGRIAFWTDDDTCKININTAGAAREGETLASGTATQSFWDLPYGGGTTEPRLARYQPAQREYQRYPGHPARVDLKTVFPFLSGTSSTATQIYNLTPRVSSEDETNGSFGGTRFATSGPLGLKRERLYATLDELFYNPSRAANNAALTSSTLSRLEGFLTGYNRAPELNLFGRPRISMWPVSNLDSKRTPLDKWFALCSTMVVGNGASVTGSNVFAVTRSDSLSATADLTCTGATIPKLFAYLQNQTQTAPPGYADSFSSKYSAAGRDQLLTLSLDYIRCVNLYDSSAQTGSLQGAPYNPNAFTLPQVNLTNYDKPWKPKPYIFTLPGIGQAVPLKISPAAVPTCSGTFKGLGRFDTTISEAAFHFWALSWDNGTPVREDDQIKIGSVTNTVGVFAQTAANLEKIARISSPTISGTGNPMYGAQLLISPFNTMCGFNRYGADYLHRVTGLSGFTVNGASIFPADPAVNWVRIEAMLAPPGGGAGGLYSTVADSVNPMGNRGNGKFAYFDGGTIASPSQRDYPFVSRFFPVPNADTTLNFSGGNLALEIFSRAGDLIQSLNLSFPQANVIKPTPVNAATISPLPNGTDNYSYAPQGRRMRSAGYFDFAPSRQICFGGDTLISVEANGPATDYRWLSLQDNPGSGFFQSHPQYSATTSGSNKACGLRENTIMEQINGPTSTGAESSIRSSCGSLLGNDKIPLGRKRPVVSSRYNTTGIRNAQGKLPDFENGFGDMPDGAYSRKPDEISIRRLDNIVGGGMTDTYGVPYYFATYGGWDGFGDDTYFAPNRQVPSPGIMGGLPSRGKDPNGAWETLLFCPNPAAGATASDHRGFNSPPDYLWMDLFTMPIVEPYAISEPFSTAGKINMNYQIVPFTYVTRSTGLRAVLAANRVSAINFSNPTTSSLTRYWIHPNETLKQFQAKFDNNQIFKSASEICSMWLYPATTGTSATALATDSAGATSGITAWWYNTGDKSGTGDNLREQPYTALYQNLTTQSNTYTVHVYVQALTQARATGKLTVTGEYRGSYALERFLDPKDPNLPDFTDPTSSNAMNYYQFRVNNTKQFVP